MKLLAEQSLAVCAAAIALAGATPGAQAQGAFPNRIVRIIVPSGTGGGGDTIARIMAEHFAERWSKQVVVENRTGASNMIGGLPHARSGRLRALGITSLTRAPGAPDIPTLHESGLPGFEAVQWYGLFAPAGTPREVTDKIYRDASAVLKFPEVRDRLAGDGATVVGANGEQFAVFIKSEMVKWAKVVKAAGIVPE